MLNRVKKYRKQTILIIFIILLLLVGNFIIKLITKPSIEAVKNSVVMIEVYDSNNNLLGTGSGFSVYESDYIVTNFHVIEGGEKFKVITDDNKSYNVEEILIFDGKNDLALLEIEAKLKPLKLGIVRSLKAGNKVTAIGSPKGQLNTVSTGVISNADDNKYLRITAPISPGSSGGVLLDKNNRVVGITSATYNSVDAQNINYAISIEYLEKMYKALRKEEYHEIENPTSEGCMHNWNNITSFNSCTRSKYDYYSAEDFDVFYETTNAVSRYNYAMTIGDWETVYDDLNYEDRKLATAYYEELKNTEFCYDECNIVKNIKKWNTTEFMINLEVLNKEELAFVISDLENYKSDDDKFYRVEEYPLDAYQKALILYLIGDRNWYSIHKNNKRDIFEHFDSKYGTEDLGAILETLGYEVVYENDGTLTAYW